MSKFPVDAPKQRVVKTLEKLGFRIVWEREHISIIMAIKFLKSRTLDMHHVPKARAIRDTRGLIKMVAEEETERVVGIHILAPEAAELIHQAVLIVRNSLTVKDVIEKIDVYPTLSEMVKLCAQSFYKDVRKLSCCAE